MANKFEKKALTQVNQLDEGLIFGMLKWLLKSKTKRVLRKLGRDPEFKATIADLNYHTEKLQDMIQDYDKRGIKIDPRLRR
tara:strand:+ start:1088 stop:1330 length:243 start_codon:yes stop_codon:yes gene_type:complete